MAKQRPLLIGHRGQSAKFAENSMEAFEAAWKIPEVDGIELDVGRSADGVYFALHDDTLDRTMKEHLMDAGLIRQVKSLDVSQLPWDLIQQVPITAQGMGCPLIKDVIKQAQFFQKSVVIELKTDYYKTQDEERMKYVEGLCQLLQESFAEYRTELWEPEKNVIFISFDLKALKLLRPCFIRNPIFYLLHFMGQEDENPHIGSIDSVRKCIEEHLVQDDGSLWVDGVETDLYAHQQYPTLQSILRDEFHLMTGIYVSAPDPRDGNAVATGDRSIEEHQFVIDNKFDLFTSDLPDAILTKTHLWAKSL